MLGFFSLEIKSIPGQTITKTFPGFRTGLLNQSLYLLIIKKALAGLVSKEYLHVPCDQFDSDKFD